MKFSVSKLFFFYFLDLYMFNLKTTDELRILDSVEIFFFFPEIFPSPYYTSIS